MKILWITNAAIEPLGTHIYGRAVNGAWVAALLSDFENVGEHKVVIATTARIRDRIRLENDKGTVFYALPDSPPINYNENNKKNIRQWQDLMLSERPDIIQVWGTEFTHGLCALRQCGNTPAVIYMQGVLDAIARYYYAGITEAGFKNNITFRDIIKKDSVIHQKRRYERNAKKEAEMLSLAGNFISENNWCDTHVKAIAPEAKPHHCPLSINSVFTEFEWNINDIERHSIMCTASGYPLKGLHIMLKALGLLRRRYPDVKLYIPGAKVFSDGSLQWHIRKRGYTKYIERLIKQLEIGDNIIWLGYTSQEQLAQLLSKRHVFALTSALENHSSSLKEAMMVGVPSVASDVGGIPEYMDNGKNGFLYRFEEYELLADRISSIFDSDILATRIGQSGRKDMIARHSSNEIYSVICDIYNKIIRSK